MARVPGLEISPSRRQNGGNRAREGRRRVSAAVAKGGAAGLGASVRRVTDAGVWDGRGLPPAAAARLERAARSGVRTSLLSVDSQAGLDLCGLVPVGEVMGTTVQHLGWQGYAGCGWGVGFGGVAPVRTQVALPGSHLPFAPYLNSLDAGWRTALSRMLAESRALGGDGVVGVRLDEQHFGQGNREFIALGTAVRSLGATHLKRPFATTLSGADVAKLLHAGWAPAGVLVCLSLGIRHDDVRTYQATMWTAGNVEVQGYTELVGDVREANRQLLAQRCAEIGADGAILTTPMRLEVHALEVSEGHRDHAAIASLVATAVAAVGGKGGHAHLPAPGSLAVLPLDRRPRKK